MFERVVAAAIMVLISGSAHSAVVSAIGSSTIYGSATGVDLTEGNRDSSAITSYDEAQAKTIGSNEVFVDYLVGANLSLGDTVAGVDSIGPTGGRALQAGTYDSHLLQFDPNGSASGISATFTFSGEIVGLIVSNSGSSALLNLSDVVFGTASAYENLLGRRVESSESLTLVSSYELRLNGWKASNPWTDEVRVITESSFPAVPLPAALPMLLAGLAGLAGLGGLTLPHLRHRRRSNAV